MSTIGIYSHFKGKQGILDALYIEGFELIEREILASDGNTPAEKVINGCERILTFSEAHAAHYQLIFSSNLNHLYLWVAFSYRRVVGGELLLLLLLKKL